MEPIKRLADLTHEEILAIPIGSEKYLQIIDLECAHAGVSLLPPHPGPKPETVGSKPDVILHKIDNFGFLKIEDAEEVIRLMAAKGLWKTTHEKGASVIVPMSEGDYYWPTIKSIAAFSVEEFAKVRDNVAQEAIVMANWQERNDAYQAVLKEREGIVKSFAEKADYAREVTNSITRIFSNLKRYLTLAQGQYPIAVGFLKEADKLNMVHVEDDSVYYVCSNGVQHPVITREQYQKNSMNDLLLGEGHG